MLLNIKCMPSHSIANNNNNIIGYIFSCLIGNSICHASSDCSDGFPGLGTQTPHSCCGTGGGSAYVDSTGFCQAC